MTDKLELKSCHEVIDTVDVADVESIFHGKPIDPDILTVVMKDGKRLYCDEVCPVDSRQEDPVSEDLNEAAKQYLYSNILYDDVYVGNPTDKDCIEMFKAGAKWQEKQDQSTIELAEDHAMLAGMEKMKEQMIAKAVETTFDVSLPSGLYDKLWIKSCKEGDKLLVIKKDEL